VRRSLLVGLAAVLACGVSRGQAPIAPGQVPQVPSLTAPANGAREAPCPPPVEVTNSAKPTRVWAGADYLLWQLRGDSLPPLLTASPPGTPQAQAGVLSAPGTTVLFGGSGVNDDWRSGWQVRGGLWLDCEQKLAVEANFFLLEQVGAGFDVTSNGTPILSRPFFNTELGRQDAQLVAFPGLLAGHVSVAEASSLLGTGAWLRCNLCCGCRHWVDGVIGYRFLRLRDRLTITENLVSTDPASATTPLGTTLDVVDRFETTNQFHGVDLGLAGEVRRGALVLEWFTRLAVGGNTGDVAISGASTFTVPGLPPMVQPGGLLALSSNSGRFSKDRVGLVPEVGLRLGYQITPWLRGSAGYNFLYWTDVIRPGTQIDTAVNPNLLPPPVPGGPARPAPRVGDTTDLWAHGFSLGLEVRF